jgi:7-carboxy-7-deazaguanine synthase
MGKLTEVQQQLLDSGEHLPLMEEFYTIQGEGYNTGQAAYFIRLGGCDVGCHWCDVKESWDASLHPLTPIRDIVDKASSFPAKAVVITGGEPLLYNLEPLCSMLHEQGIRVFLETSGAYPVSGSFDWICVSPKKFKNPRPDMLAIADELKVIVFNKQDFDWAEQHTSFLKSDCLHYLQPEWSKASILMPEIVEFVKMNPQWKISLQTHKYMHIP